MIEPKFAIKTKKGLFIATDIPPYDKIEDAKNKRAELNDFELTNFYKVIEQNSKYYIYKLKN